MDFLHSIVLTDKDVARIFQALAQEARRLDDLPEGWRTQDVVDHTAALRDKFAAIHPSNERRAS